MCQEIIREWLSECPSRWFTIREIMVGTGLSLNSVFNSCLAMRKSRTVFFQTKSMLVGRSMKDVIVYKFKRCSDDR